MAQTTGKVASLCNKASLMLLAITLLKDTASHKSIQQNNNNKKLKSPKVGMEQIGKRKVVSLSRKRQRRWGMNIHKYVTYVNGK